MASSGSSSFSNLVKDDPWLEPFDQKIKARQKRFQKELASIKMRSGSLSEEASSHLHFGFQKNHLKGTLDFREWAPAAQSLCLIGDFNDWSAKTHPLTQTSQGIWECSLDPSLVQEGQRFKLRIVNAAGEEQDRIPSHATRVVQDPETLDFAAEVSFFSPPVHSPLNEDQASQQLLKAKQAPVIYEAHIGMAGEEPRIHSFREFTKTMIPHIASSGYNTIQLMAIAEHPYYGSFGYHVSNFFAPSSRFGTAKDLHKLIQTAHDAGLVVLMDIVHSHAVKNMAEGLNDFDGSGGLYFHNNDCGNHPQWDSKCFNYGHPQVRTFLLSNIRYWIETFDFDGFRFDGITSMLYWHRGLHSFDHYGCYFEDTSDEDAILYLQLACQLIRDLKPNALIIAEDMSGFPGLCRPPEDGGIGFTHRLAMGIPDYWIKLLKETPDEYWNLDEMIHTLSNRRYKEATIAYAESHDQALVGDKTLAFQLMDAEMYWHMNTSDSSLIIDRGIALHKLIRSLTLILGGEGYLAFMGNEFGHPEWVDFPREGNQWSYQHCRRQWSLLKNKNLRYKELYRYDVALLQMAHSCALLKAAPAHILFVHNDEKILILERASVLFIINLHPHKFYPSLPVTPSKKGIYKPILNSDEPQFGGFQQTAPVPVTISSQHPTFLIPLPPRSLQGYHLSS